MRMTSAITPSMLALSSAACKALRFASTARERGLRALTHPANVASLDTRELAGGDRYASKRNGSTRGWNGPRVEQRYRDRPCTPQCMATLRDERQKGGNELWVYTKSANTRGALAIDAS